MSTYAPTHARAASTVARKGASVTFTREGAGRTHDPETGLYSGGTATTVTGSAVQIPGDPERYQALNLVLATMPTLLFAPATYGETPLPGDTCVWSGRTFVVKDVDGVQPDGSLIVARVIVA